jgi:molybdopterin molybdotransferase
MIDPARAQALVARHCPAPAPARVDVDDAIGCVLAEDVRASVALPPFDNSAMDGYALKSTHTARATASRPIRLQLDGAIYAGDSVRTRLRSGQARAIMTGAPLPPGADAVLERELAAVDAGMLVVSRPVSSGRHVRRRGEEVKRGARLLRVGEPLLAGSAAVLATAGRARVRVYRKPEVAVITTGNEAVPPGMSLRPGQIFDSNTAMVTALVRGSGYRVTRARRVKDHPGAIRNAAAAALARAGVVVFTGGVSVGDRDYLRPVLERLRVREVFWRVRQKPGKPLYFGTRGRRLVFGLPGNPASAFTCFFLYVLPALWRISGVTPPPAAECTLTDTVERDPTRWRFLKGHVTRRAGSEGNEVMPLPAQASHMTTSLARTNALIEVPPGSGAIASGKRVSVHLLPVGEVVG